jgi:hypothetical protein
MSGLIASPNSSPIGESQSWVFLGDYTSPRKVVSQTPNGNFVSEDPIDIESQETLKDSIAAAIRSSPISFLPLKKKSEEEIALRVSDSEEADRIKKLAETLICPSGKVVQRKVNTEEPLQIKTGSPSDESSPNSIDTITVIAIGVFLCSQVGFALSKSSDSKRHFPVTQVGFFITGVLSGLVATGKIIQWIKKS